MAATTTQSRAGTSLRSAWLFINRIAGGCDKSSQHARLRALVDGMGIETVEVCSPAELAIRWNDESAARPDFIISAGGDGTAAMIVGQTQGEVPLAIYPAGTENVLAKYLHIPTDFDAFARMIAERHVIRLDTGRCNDRTFLLMLSAGFEAEVVHQVHQHRKGHLSKLDYVLPTFRNISSYAYPSIEVDIEREDGSRVQTEGFWAFVFNVPRYALGTQLAPQAQPNDGLLDVCVLNRKGLWATASYITSLLAGRISFRRDLQYFRARSLKIHCPGGPLPIQTDGDPAGQTDAIISVQPNHLPLIVPAPGS